MGKNKILTLAFIFIFASCENSSNQRVEELEIQVLLLNTKIEQLEKQAIAEPNLSEELNQDSILPSKTPILEEKLNGVKKKEKVEKKIEQPVTRSANPKQKSDTTFYFYKNSNKKSIVVYPAVNGRSIIEFYDPFGKKTFEMEEVRLSYTVGINFMKWHENGSVEQIEENVNPGASINFYENTYYFDINNNPTWKSTYQYPPELDSRKDYYWKESEGKWILQEVMEGPPAAKP